MQEIMILRKNVDNETRLKIFQVDETTLSKLTRIRGTLYEDNPRLKLARDLPTPEPEIEITPEMRQRAEHAAFVNRMMIEAGERSQAAAMLQTPQPERPKTPEELWRHDPELRREFQNNFNAYQAYLKGMAAGRCRIFGR